MKKKLFLILWLAGFAGVVSFLLVDLVALLESLPITAGKPMPFSPTALKFLSLIQPTVILTVFVLVGVALANRVSLASPAAEALAGGGEMLPALRPQIVPGVIAGLVGGAAIILMWFLARPHLPPLFVTRAEHLNTLMPLPTRLLYGGFTEELLLRWGVMTLLVWLPFRVFQKGKGRPSATWVVVAIFISSIVFGMGHLPIASALGVGLTVPIVAYVVTANSLFGFIAGYLYWKKGLEAAIIAHMFAHVVIVSATLFVSSLR
jgi:Type II CAAX prenyl endopeptidase Rce1-like